MFQDRNEAGEKLAQALAPYRQQQVVVYALPRGGVVLGARVAHFLGAPVDLLLVRKIGHPFAPEYAIGAVAEDGYILMEPKEAGTLDSEWLKKAALEGWNEARRRRRVYLGERQPVPVSGKIAIIVDDGLATGLTMKAAIHQLRNRHPRRIVVAVPIAPQEAAAEIRPEVDELVVLTTPEEFQGGIGYYYRDFNQVTDDEVLALISPPPGERDGAGDKEMTRQRP